MTKPLDEARSLEIAQQISSKSRKPFDNAYKAALKTEGATYVQGFLVIEGKSRKPIEHAWIELEDCIIDPNLPHIIHQDRSLFYFAAQSLTVKKLKAIIDESKEDYPDDDPLPIYGTMPYEYYGDVMLGDRPYLDAYNAAQEKCSK